jgi:hypothetical protein
MYSMDGDTWNICQRMGLCDLLDDLKAEDGEAVAIRYDGGSEPGKLRHVFPENAYTNPAGRPMLTAICGVSGGIKTFHLDKIRIEPEVVDDSHGDVDLYGEFKSNVISLVNNLLEQYDEEDNAVESLKNAINLLEMLKEKELVREDQKSGPVTG